MVRKINHVGLAVEKIEPVAAFYKEMFGAEFVADRVFDTPEFFSRTIRMGDNMFELMEPRGENGLIERFLKTRGQGIHHLALVVEDPAAFFKKCDEKGMTVLGGRFVHPKNTHGVLIEIVGPDAKF